MDTKLHSTTIAILVSALTAGCGGKTNESLHPDARPGEVTLTGSATDVGLVGSATAATPAAEQVPVPELQPVPDDTKLGE